MSTNSIVKTIIIVFTGGILILCLLAACFLLKSFIDHAEDYKSWKKVYYLESVEKYIRIDRPSGLGGGLDIYFSKTLMPLLRDSCDASMVHKPYYQLDYCSPQYFILDKSDTIVIITPSQNYNYKQNDLVFLLADNIDLVTEYFPLELGTVKRHAPTGKTSLIILPDYSGIKIFDSENNECIPDPLFSPQY